MKTNVCYLGDCLDDLQIGIAGEHLVCADLIIKGYKAYLSDQGLPYDVLLDINGKLFKIQVKTTSKYRSVPQRKTHTPAYLFWIKRKGRNGKRVYKNSDYDFMALVALDKKIIGYLPFNNVKATMHINEEKLLSLTFEKLCLKK